MANPMLDVMTKNFASDVSPTPGIPEELVEKLVPDQGEFTDTFTLHYRSRGDMLHLHFNFPVSTNISAREHFRLAIDRAKLHCERMRYRFLFCRPYITDLEMEERRMPV